MWEVGRGLVSCFPRASWPEKPWSTPTVEEVPIESLPAELRMLVLGLPDPARAPLDADAVADVQPQAEKAPPSSEPDCVVCGDDLYRCFPLRCPLRKVH
jgi:hypothetical protein